MGVSDESIMTAVDPASLCVCVYMFTLYLNPRHSMPLGIYSDATSE